MSYLFVTLFCIQLTSKTGNFIRKLKFTRCDKVYVRLVQPNELVLLSSISTVIIAAFWFFL